MTAATPEQGIDPSSTAYRVHAHAFNTLSRMLAYDDKFVPLSEREAIASAIVEVIEPIIRADERGQDARPAPELAGQVKHLVVTLRRISDQQEASGHPEGAYATGCAATMVEALIPPPGCGCTVCEATGSPHGVPQPAPELAAAVAGAAVQKAIDARQDLEAARAAASKTMSLVPLGRHASPDECDQIRRELRAIMTGLPS